MLNSQDQHIYSVSQLNREARLLLEQQFGSIWLEGEISNLARPASGHWYLSLKDQQAQLRCAMFKNRNRTLRFAPQNGDQVLVRGVLGLYEARGDFQLIIDRMEPVGEGQLQRRFEQMRAKLLAEGLFDDAHKQPLPPYPQSIR
ncbi:MAG TPA: exodeoxyribonuclease VII large subunit, partial [Gammaproteobacteria bacterium]|nr:exodeoxyribonuclease VII large subunit [Gammaproteobacteria bacterium]